MRSAARIAFASQRALHSANFGNSGKRDSASLSGSPPAQLAVTPDFTARAQTGVKAVCGPRADFH